MKSSTQVYKEILSKTIMERNQGSPITPEVLEHENENPKKNVIRYDDDLTAAVQLLEQGFSLPDVIRTLKMESPMAKDLPTERAKDIYIDKVLENVNREWTHKSDHSYAVAQESYKNRLASLMHKYQEYDKNSIGLYQDGEIALALVIAEGFSPEIAENVVRHNSPSAEMDASYLMALRSSLDDTMHRYAELNAFDGKNIVSEGDIYRKQAKLYMDRSKTSILNGYDEQKIIEGIYTQLVKNLKKDHPEFESDPDQLDAIMSTQIKPFLRRCIVDASPVYTEPGRDKEQYVASVLSEFESNYETRKKLSKWRYPVTQDLYLGKIEMYQNRVKQYNAMQDQAFFDALAAKELLEERQAPINIIRAIKENSSFNPLDTDPDPERAKQDYAEHVVKMARSCLDAEKKIMNFEMLPEIPAGKPLDEVDLTMPELFRQMMKERIESYPAFALELTEPFADRDAVEKLIHKFPDYNRYTLQEAIMEASPRAQLPGISPNYGEKVIKAAEERLAKIREHEKTQMNLQNEYNRLRGLSSEGVDEGNNPMSTLKDGRIALKMIRDKVHIEDIKKYLILLAKAAAISSPIVYADNILTAVGQVLEREQDIAQFTGADKEADVRSCSDVYMEKMHRQYIEKEIIQPSMDIRSFKEILQETSYKPEQLKEIILRKSPIAVEPGRDKGYADYVFEQAQIEIKKDNERLNRYVVIPRLTTEASLAYLPPLSEKTDELNEKLEELKEDLEETKKNAAKAAKPTEAEELQYQREKMQKDLDMPLCLAMDAIICGALLAAGYAQDGLVAALDNNPPESWQEEQGAYSQAVMHDVSDRVEAFTETLEETLVQVRTIETTTTTVTTTITEED